MAMVLTDHARVLQVAADLVNSAPHGEQGETMTDAGALAELARSWIVTEVQPAADTDVTRLHRYRERLRAIFLAPDEATRIMIVNQLLAATEVYPRLVEHDGLDLHIHYFAPYAPLSEHLIADCTMVLALLFESGEGARLKHCAAPDCGTVFVDRTKNRSRLYCDSQACGNRLHAAAYRARATRNG